VGPGVAVRGVDGPQPADGNQPHDPNSTHTVPQASAVGTWVEETDLRPTLLHLVGLHDDYPSDGAVITAALTAPSPALQATAELAADYQQVNSSVGRFATNTLIADSAALASGTAADDTAFTQEQQALLALANTRDHLANQIKSLLAGAAAGHTPTHGQIVSARARARALLAASQRLAEAAPH